MECGCLRVRESEYEQPGDSSGLLCGSCVIRGGPGTQFGNSPERPAVLYPLFIEPLFLTLARTFITHNSIILWRTRSKKVEMDFKLIWLIYCKHYIKTCSTTGSTTKQLCLFLCRSVIQVFTVLDGLSRGSCCNKKCVTFGRKGCART